MNQNFRNRSPRHRGGRCCRRGKGGGGRGALVEAAALAALLGSKAHGYELRRRISEMTAGKMEVDTGGLYRVLHRLEDEGFVASTWLTGDSVPQRRDYEITPEGRELASDWKERLRERQQVFGLLAQALEKALATKPAPATETSPTPAAQPKTAPVEEAATDSTPGQPPSIRVAISTLGPTLDDRLDERFGRATYLLVVDPEGRHVKVVDNRTNQQAMQGAGLGAAEKVLEHKARVVLTGHLGPKAFRALHEAGIEGFDGTGMTAREALDAWRAGRLNRLGQADAHQGLG